MKSEQTETGFYGTSGGTGEGLSEKRADAFGKAFQQILDRGDEKRAWEILEGLYGTTFCDVLDDILKTQDQEPDPEPHFRTRSTKSAAELFAPLFDDVRADIRSRS